LRPLPSPSAGLPRCSNHHAYVPCPLPRRIGTGAFVDCFPVPRGLPQTLGGSASALSFSRPAQASLALRPACLLNRPRRPLSRGFGGAGCLATPPVSYQLNRQLAGWNPPPQVIRASEAHQSLRTSAARSIPSPWSWEGRSAVPSKTDPDRDQRRFPTRAGPISSIAHWSETCRVAEDETCHLQTHAAQQTTCTGCKQASLVPAVDEG
jgi:hypothetical protein